MVKHSSRWKSCESIAGIWLGSWRSGTLSGRVPLSGQNSGTTRSDTCHNSIFCEVKRSKSFLSVVKLHKKYHNEIKRIKPKGTILILHLPTEENRKIVSKTSDIVCFHNNDAEGIIENKREIIHKDWDGPYPSALTLYKNTIAIWKSSVLDRNKQLAHCALFSHGDIGFWIIINKNDIVKWWELILEARIERERLIEEEAKFKSSQNDSYDDNPSAFKNYGL